MIETGGAVQAAARTARVLRRVGFGPHPGQVADYIDLEPADIARARLELSPIEAPASRPKGPKGEYDEWWMQAMIDPDAGVHERMVWFWHSHFTSARSDVDVR